MSERSTQRVTARFYPQKITTFGYSQRGGWAEPAPMIEVELMPVTGGKNPGNQAWASATPSGSIKMTIGNPAAVEFFQAMQREGKDIAITFEERDPAELEPGFPVDGIH